MTDMTYMVDKALWDSTKQSYDAVDNADISSKATALGVILKNLYTKKSEQFTSTDKHNICICKYIIDDLVHMHNDIYRMAILQDIKAQETNNDISIYDN